MGRLLNPTIGDLFDRLVILALKIEECTILGRDAKHFQVEAAAIGVELQKSGPPLASTYCRMARLAAINAMIWFAEEAANEYPWSEGEPADHIGALRVLLRIRKLNQDRSRVIDGFDPTRGKEKIHDGS